MSFHNNNHKRKNNFWHSDVFVLLMIAAGTLFSLVFSMVAFWLSK